MTVPVVFEGGILQNDELFSFLEEVKSKVPDIVNSKDCQGPSKNVGFGSLKM